MTIIVKLNDIVRCHDFPSNPDCYIIGKVVEITMMLRCEIIKVVEDGEMVTHIAGSTFLTAKPGEGWMDDMFGDWERVQVLG